MTRAKCIGCGVEAYVTAGSCFKCRAKARPLTMHQKGVLLRLRRLEERNEDWRLYGCQADLVVDGLHDPRGDNAFGPQYGSYRAEVTAAVRVLTALETRDLVESWGERPARYALTREGRRVAFSLLPEEEQVWAALAGKAALA